MKIKLVGAGWTSFTGHFGVTEFVNGESVRDVTDMEMKRLSAVVQIETFEGKDPSVAQQIIDSRTVPMEIATTPVVEVPVVERPVMTYTAKDLEEIADKGGIKALREVADQFGVKGKSITELIRELGALAPKAE